MTRIKSPIQHSLNVLLISCLSLFISHSVFAFDPVPKAGWSDEYVAGVQTALYVPDSTPLVDGKRALMVVLHGCLQTSTDVAKWSDWESTAEAYGMVVAGLNVPDNGGLLGCWRYWAEQTDKDAETRTSPKNPKGRNEQDQKAVLDMVAALLNRSELNLDDRQIFITGISSGAGMVMNLACEAPDVFAAVGMFDGPTIGASAAMKGPIKSSSQSDGIRICNEVSGSYSSHFSTQVASIAYGDESLSLPSVYSQYNANVMADMYNANRDNGCESIEAGSNSASEITWSDANGPRVSLVSMHGMLHRWPAGPNSNPEALFATGDYISWQKYFSKFAFDNNRRANSSSAGTDDGIYDGGSCTEYNNLTFTDSFAVYMNFLSTGGFDEFDRQVAEIKAIRAERCEPFEPSDAIPGCQHDAVDEAPAITLLGANPVSLEVGTIFVDPGATANDNEDGDLTSSIIAGSDCNNIDTNTVGSYSCTYSVTDSFGHTASATRTINVNAGMVDSDGDGIADENDNCPNTANADQLDNDQDGQGNLCDATPNGPDNDGDGITDSLDNCPNVANPDQLDNDGDGEGNLCDATPDGAVSCTSYTSSISQHVSSNRAYKEGLFFLVSYFAVGSDEKLSGFSFSTVTLHRLNNEASYHIGGCP